jgi:hypothetical protein
VKSEDSLYIDLRHSTVQPVLFWLENGAILRQPARQGPAGGETRALEAVTFQKLTSWTISLSINEYTHLGLVSVFGQLRTYEHF